MKVVRYMSCLILSKFTRDIDKKIKEYEGQLAAISQPFTPHLVFASSLEAQVMDLTDKIKSLHQERDQIINRVGDLRSLISPQLDTLLSSQQDAVSALGKAIASDLKEKEIHDYMFNTLINFLDCFLRGWNEYLKSLKITYANIFKFL